jgi:hypothetical protein
MSKHQVNVRLSDETQGRLDDLSLHYGTQTTALEVAINLLWQQLHGNTSATRLPEPALRVVG